MNYKEMRRKNLEAHNILDLLRKSEPVLKDALAVDRPTLVDIEAPLDEWAPDFVQTLERKKGTVR